MRTITLEHSCMQIPHSIIMGKGRGWGDNYMILYIAMSLHVLPYQFHHCFGGQGTLHKHNSWGAISQTPPPKPWGRSKQPRDHGHSGMPVTPLCDRRMRPRGNTA